MCIFCMPGIFFYCRGRTVEKSTEKAREAFADLENAKHVMEVLQVKPIRDCLRVY